MYQASLPIASSVLTYQTICWPDHDIVKQETLLHHDRDTAMVAMWLLGHSHLQQLFV